MSDRCLAVLEELELENKILKTENMSLKKVLVGLSNENKGYRDAVARLITIIERYEKGIE